MSDKKVEAEKPVERASKKNVAKRCKGKKVSELSAQDKGWLFPKRASIGEINAVVTHNSLVDDRHDYLKRHGMVVAPVAETDARYDALLKKEAAAKKAK